MGLFSKDIKTLDDLFVHTLQDIYYAENQITQALPDMIAKATDPGLKQAFQNHLAETQQQIKLVEQVFRQHGHEPEHGGDLTGCPVGRRLVDVGQPGQVGQVARVGHRVLRLGGRVERTAVVGTVGAVTGRGAALKVGHLAFAPLAAIQMAKAMSPPMPTIQAHSPSLTGPSPPRLRPPWLGFSCRSLR